MKTPIIFCFIVFPFLLCGQEMPTKKDQATFEVLGNCGMCKKRIEKAAFSVDGVKYASWDIPSGQLSLIYNGLKTDLSTIGKKIAISGHDSKYQKAANNDYENLPACCQYLREGEEPKPGQMTKH